MKHTNLLLAASVMAAGLLLFPTVTRAQAPTIRGTLIDGTSTLKSGGVEALTGGSLSPDTPRVPVASTAFELRAISGIHAGKSWSGQTDAGGGFELALDGLSALPAERVFVASVRATPDRSSLHSIPAALGSGDGTEFRVYEITEDPSFVRSSGLEVLYTLEDAESGEGKEIDVRVNLLAGNFSGTLFVGSKYEATGGRQQRAVFRVPLPDGFRITKNEAMMIHDRQTFGGWTITPDGWAIIDQPLPPFTEASSGVYYTLRYRVPARQSQAFAYPVDFPLERLLVWSIHLDMDISAHPPLASKFTDKRPDPDAGTGPDAPVVTWDILADRNLQAGRTVGIGLKIDSLVLREFNDGAVKVVGGLVVGCLVAVLVGLVLGRRGPRVETILAEATGEEIIQRIAQLDARFENGKVAEREYREMRIRLLAMARYEIPELAGSGESTAGESPPAAPSGPSEKVRRLSRRIQELEGSEDPAATKEKILLLEDLARAVAEEI